MSQLSREACIEIGVAVPTGPLIGWATEQLSAARSQKGRLQHRGIRPPFLDELKRLIEQIAEGQGSLGKEKTALPAEVIQAKQVREEAFAYWQEIKQIVKTEFGTVPEIQAQFHLGVHTGRLISNLVRELEADMTLLRAHKSELAWLGVDETFLRKGDVLVGKLKEAKGAMETTCKGLPAQVADQSAKKGQLYDLTRKLVRCGQLEFIQEPEQATAFNYGVLRKELRAGSEVRVKSTPTGKSST